MPDFTWQIYFKKFGFRLKCPQQNVLTFTDSYYLVKNNSSSLPFFIKHLTYNIYNLLLTSFFKHFLISRSISLQWPKNFKTLCWWVKEKKNYTSKVSSSEALYLFKHICIFQISWSFPFPFLWKVVFGNFFPQAGRGSCYSWSSLEPPLPCWKLKVLTMHKDQTKGEHLS